MAIRSCKVKHIVLPREFARQRLERTFGVLPRMPVSFYLLNRTVRDIVAVHLSKKVYTPYMRV
jgi:hypothetical protein